VGQYVLRKRNFWHGGSLQQQQLALWIQLIYQRLPTFVLQSTKTQIEQKQKHTLYHGYKDMFVIAHLELRQMVN
jgi:hypothetical protein